MKTPRKVFDGIRFVPRIPFLVVIWVYQRTLSPDHGPLAPIFPNGYCRFYPSCSEYGRQAYRKHGATKGTALTAYRILRCNPWNPGGEDQVPEKGSVTKTFTTKHLLS